MGNRRPLGEINNVVGARPHPCTIAIVPVLARSRVRHHHICKRSDVIPEVG
jgi:hypothetical protein